MARLTCPLSHSEILKTKPQDKDYTLHDGGGLFLLVKSSGKKLWRLRYQRPGTTQRTNISLGAYVSIPALVPHTF